MKVVLFEVVAGRVLIAHVEKSKVYTYTTPRAYSNLMVVYFGRSW